MASKAATGLELEFIISCLSDNTFESQVEQLRVPYGFLLAGMTLTSSLGPEITTLCAVAHMAHLLTMWGNFDKFPYLKVPLAKRVARRIVDFKEEPYCWEADGKCVWSLEASTQVGAFIDANTLSKTRDDHYDEELILELGRIIAVIRPASRGRISLPNLSK